MLIWIIALVAAAVAGVMRIITGKYVFSPLTTLFCALAALASGINAFTVLLSAGFAFSIVGDWFLAHQGGGKNRFIMGVAGFLTAHALFSAGAFTRFDFSLAPLTIALALLVAYMALLPLRYFKKMDKPLRFAVSAYMLISILSLYAAMSADIKIISKILYIAGIASIVFSDTMIGEDEFADNKRAGKLVLPTYYACHALIALAACLM